MNENRVIAADADSSGMAMVGGAIGITADRKQWGVPGPTTCPSAMRAVVTASVSETTAASVARRSGMVTRRSYETDSHLR